MTPDERRWQMTVHLNWIVNHCMDIMYAHMSNQYASLHTVCSTKDFVYVLHGGTYGCDNNTIT